MVSIDRLDGDSDGASSAKLTVEFKERKEAEIAKAKGRTVAQVALRWLVQQNVASIPRSSDPRRVAENFDIFNFTLSDVPGAI